MLGRHSPERATTALAPSDPYQRLLACVDQLAAVTAAWEAGLATYRELAAAFDAVAAAREDAGVDLRLTCMEDV